MDDRTWIEKPIKSTEYKSGVVQFLDFAFSKVSRNGQIVCPCISCGFRDLRSRDEVYSHLLLKGFPTKYTRWYLHREESIEPSGGSVTQVEQEPIRQYPMHDLLNDALGAFEDYGPQDPEPLNQHQSDHARYQREVRNEELDKIQELLRDGNQPLYDGSTKYSKLSFIVHLYHIKVLCGATDKTISMIIELLKDAFQYAKLPTSFPEAKQMIKRLSLSYEKIHVCPNDCMLYWGPDETRDKCKDCHTSRWKPIEMETVTTNAATNQEEVKKKPAKILRYFPLIPRLQRLYMSSKTAKDMKWHAMDANPDGLLRHPRDSKAWKEFDLAYPDFALDPRNVRLALATDGFNPFGTLSSSYSIWPVMLYTYNLPPWMTMKQTSLIMSMVIPGPKMPGNKIDVYLQPLIVELLQLWNGVDTYDSSTNEMFRMRAALMWTISDFPGLDNLSGWNTHTSLACPICNFETDSKRLKFGKKNCFMGHRRGLPLNHKFRYDKEAFDGSIELRHAPIPLSGSLIIRQIEESLNRSCNESTSENGPRQWKKRSIFWDLPYWEHSRIRHCLDMMHIEKNVCDNVLFTVLADKKKSKDNVQARKDLEAMGIRKKLHPYPNSCKFPHACFTMKNQEKDVFFKVLKSVVVPDGYSSNISRSVDCKKRKISNLKSHDSHILMEYILPIAFRRCLPKEVTSVLIELSNYFRELSCKVLNVKNLERLHQRVILTLCHLEMIFPPSFFTIMVHLVVHLAEEAMIAGPIHFRWMYPIERALGHLKSYVRNKAAPEGCIAEGYIFEECLTFYSRYLDNIETRFNRPRRNGDENESIVSSEYDVLSTRFPALGRPLGAVKIVTLSPFEKIQAHRYVLHNCDITDKFHEKFTIEVKRMNRGKRTTSKYIEEYVHKHFHEWFRNHVARKDDPDITPEIEVLAQGLNIIARRFEGYNVNGFKFRTKLREKGLRTQNSGVVMVAEIERYSNANDENPGKVDLMYYRRLLDIIELDYYGELRVVLFKCEWVDPTLKKGVKIDDFGITSVNFSRLIHTGEQETDEPYVLATDVRMVYFVDDPIDQGWSCVCHMKPRDIYDMGDRNLIDLEHLIMEDIPFPDQDIENIDELQLVREDDNEQVLELPNFMDEHNSNSDDEDDRMSC